MNNKKMNDIQLSGAIVSATIITASLIYWAVQIQAVRDMLSLAYD